jgi:HK97 gp10 family phage protein
MSNDSEFISGGAALDALLQTLPTKVEKNIMRSALRAGAKVFLEEVKQNIPYDTGTLRASARITTRGRAGAVTASVKVGNRQAFYANMVEFGTRPHKIVAPRGHSLNVNGQEVRSVDHPGIRPHPFARPAAEHRFREAVAAVQAKVRQRLTKLGLETPEPVPAEENEA